MIWREKIVLVGAGAGDDGEELTYTHQNKSFSLAIFSGFFPPSLLQINT